MPDSEGLPVGEIRPGVEVDRGFDELGRLVCETGSGTGPHRGDDLRVATDSDLAVKTAGRSATVQRLEVGVGPSTAP